MMKLSKLYCTAALLVGLTGCATTGPGGAPVAKAVGLVAKVQQYATVYCSFEPTISSVSKILATFGGVGAVAGESLAENVARAICTAVTTQSSVQTSAVEEAAPIVNLVAFNTALAQAKPAAKTQPKASPTVNGVTVRGRFVR